MTMRTGAGAGSAGGEAEARQEAGEAKGRVHVHQERWVKVAPERIFARADEIEWLPGLAASGGPGHIDSVGTTFPVTLRMLGQEFRGQGRVADAVARRLVHLRVDCSGTHGGVSEWTFRFTPVGAATRCSLDIACSDVGANAGVVVMLERLFGRPALLEALERVAQEILADVARQAEAAVTAPA